jgi:uncharacterized protein YdaU (DUF1376 family)
MKDPAFLFYSKDFYEGTRMMLPEERACYVDLLIYQHQNGTIPNDTRRLLMYCSGCTEQTIKDVLNQKFNQMVDGWLNVRLAEEIAKRSTNKPKKTAAACFAGLISRSKLNKKQQEKIKKLFIMDDFIKENGEVIKDENLIKSKVREWFKKMVNQMVNNKANANANEDGNVIKNENVDVEIYPTFDDFWNEYDKKVGRKEKIKAKWEKLSQQTKEAIMIYIPNYKQAQPNKQYRKNPETFLNNQSWKDEIISNGNRNTSYAKSDSDIKSEVNHAVDELLG